jgi:hypothetical protein
MARLGPASHASHASSASSAQHHIEETDRTHGRRLEIPQVNVNSGHGSGYNAATRRREGTLCLAQAPSIILCPYCGHTQHAPADRCGSCGGYFDALSRKVTQQHMGPWFIRDLQTPYRPGCSYETLSKMIAGGKIKPETVMRGPTTRQFWTVAWRVPGVAHLIGFCHQCEEPITKGLGACPKCQADFPTPNDRNFVGIDPVDTAVQQQVQQARAAAAPSATAAAAPAPAQTVEQGAAVFGGEEAAPSAEAVEWMEASAGLEMAGVEASAGPSRRTTSRSSQIVFALVLGNLVLVAAVLAVVYLGGDKQSLIADLNKPTPSTPAKDGKPKPPEPIKDGASKDGGKTNPVKDGGKPMPPKDGATKPPIPPRPMKLPPKPAIFHIDPKSAVAVSTGGGASFFGIPIGGDGGKGVKITKQKVLQIIERYNKAADDFTVRGKEKQAARDLRVLRDTLPKSIQSSGGMNQAINAMERWIKEAGI